MNAVIIEDEKNAQEALLSLLNLIDLDIKVIGIEDNVNDAIKIINNLKPDITFLDIHLKNGTGFDVIEKLNNYKGRIVFTTAHKDYAIKAFKFSAFDYILKPISPTYLSNTIKEIKAEIDHEVKYLEMLKVLTDNKSNLGEPKIILKTLNNQFVITISKIIRCESEGAYTKFFTEGKTLLTSKNLKFYDEILSEHHFIRTHQSHLINYKYINRLNKNGYVEMKDHTQIPISARKKASVNKQIKNLIP
jgi:two-component system LytT family response regulator